MFKRCTAVLALVIVIGFGVSGQTFISLVSLDDFRFGAYFDFRFRFTSFMMEIEAERETQSETALAQVSYYFPQFSGTWFARIEFQQPAEIAGDIYLVESSRRVKDVYFWNESLLEPILLDNQFLIFGDASVFELLGYRLGDGDYFVQSTMPAEGEFNFHEPETPEDISRVGRPINVIESTVVPRPGLEEFVVFPQIRLLTYNTLLPYQIQLLDEDGDLLHTIEYDWRDFTTTELGGFNRPYAMQQVIINHLVPGNRTTLRVSEIEHPELTTDLFNPNNLGQED